MLYKINIDEDSIKRYSRQIIVNQIGIDGQKKLNRSKVLIFGMGGLGSPVLMYIAAAGVGTIGIVDYDKVELTNLHRQVLHTEKSIGMAKTESAVNFVKRLAPHVKINYYNIFANLNNLEIVDHYDVIIDCTDNIDTRYFISDSCKFYQKPLIMASVLRFEGQIYALPENGPCYRCLFPKRLENIQTCDSSGVIGSVCGIIGSMQATEALKYLLGERNAKLIVYDAWKVSLNTFDIFCKRKDDCNICKDRTIPAQRVFEHLDSSFIKIGDDFKVTWDQYLKNKNKYKLIDIRPSCLYKICYVKDSINIPASDIRSKIPYDFKTSKNPLLLCKRGITAKKIAASLIENNQKCYFIKGGLESFKNEVDSTFPLD